MKMRMRMAFYVLFVLLSASCSKEAVESTANIEAENALEIEAELLNIVNDYRVSIGKSVLIHNEFAYEQANLHNDYMIAKGSLSHDNFSSRASKISNQFDVKNIAENVARNYDTANKAFEKWLSSTNHKATIEGDFTDTAVSVKKNEVGEYYYTQLFINQ